jgi:3-oxoacyl-[acyl-carrier protein] reductase
MSENASQVALITGAGRGIGKTLAIGFAKVGIDLILTARTTEQLEETKQECEKLGRKVLIFPADVSNYEQVSNLIKKGLETFGKIDILINNAGYSRLKKIERMRVEEFQGILNTNVLGVYNCTHAVIASMLEKGKGTIINTGSLIIKSPGPRWSAYAMSKSALVGFTESLGEELKSNKITINTIMPNIVDTPLFRTGLTEDDVKRMNPMLPEVLVPYYLFFTTDDAKKVTGLCIDVDVIQEVRKLVELLPAEQQPSANWDLLDPLAKEKLSAEDYKHAKKARKLINYLLAFK